MNEGRKEGRKEEREEGKKEGRGAGPQVSLFPEVFLLSGNGPLISFLKAISILSP